MRKTTARRSFPIAAMFVCFVAGLATGWWLHAMGPPGPAEDLENVAASETSTVPPVLKGSPRSSAESRDGFERRAIPLIGRTADSPTLDPDEAIDELRGRSLRLPIDDVKAESLKGAFLERRSGAKRGQHEASDILSPRNTPIHAVEDGTIVKLFLSKAGGQTIYQFDPTSRFCYYYAHLERYPIGLHEGQHVDRGDVIGFVGTSGNAPQDAPHLHFAIFVLTPEKKWWQGAPLDPYLVFRKQ